MTAITTLEKRKRTLSLMQSAEEHLLESRVIRKVNRIFQEPVLDQFLVVRMSDEPCFKFPPEILISDEVAVFRPLLDRLSTVFIKAYRNSHEVLSHLKEVRFNPARQCWAIVWEENIAPIPLFVGGFAVHIIPLEEAYFTPTRVQFPDGIPMCHYDIGFGSLPTDQALLAISQEFEHSIGIQVMLGGYINILYSDADSARRAEVKYQETGHSPYISRSRYGDTDNFSFRYRFVSQVECNPTIGGHQVSLTEKCDWTPSKMPRGCIGTKIRMQNEDYLTTVTHGLVQFSTAKKSAVSVLVDKLSSLIFHGQRIKSVGLKSGPELVGSEIYLANPPGTSEKNEVIGIVSRVYDDAKHKIMSWPRDFRHDLTLITAKEPDQLPKLTSADLPVIADEFIEPDLVWSTPEHHMCFVAHYDVINEEDFLYTGTGVHPNARPALISGFAAAWPSACDRDSRRQFARSFLWRTGPIAPAEKHSSKPNDRISVQGASGALLCVGDPKGKQCRALCFQNYECRFFGKGEKDWLNSTVKGGFFLPTEVQNAKILYTPSATVCPNSDPGPSRVAHLPQERESTTLFSRGKPPPFGLAKALRDVPE